MKKLEDTVHQQILLSLGLEPEKKKWLLERLPKLSSKQLKTLQSIFEEELNRRETMLHEFFINHPERFLKYQQQTQTEMNTLYHDIEDQEKNS